MVDEMTQQERTKMINNIKAFKDILFVHKVMEDALLKWESNKDVVIKKLGYSSDMDLIITYIHYLNAMGGYLRHIQGFDDMTAEEITNTKGTTKAVEAIMKYFNKENELRKQYAREVKRFEKEYDKTFKKGR